MPNGMRRGGRKDGNHAQIRDDLRKIYGKDAVRDTSDFGDGFPDLIVGIRLRNFFLEIKNPDQPPSKRKLKAGQKSFRDNWNGQYDVVTTLEEAQEAIRRSFPR